MADLPTKSPCNTHDLHNEIPTNTDELHKLDGNDLRNQIPVEIVSEEEMALIKSALSLAARVSPSLSLSSSVVSSSSPLSRFRFQSGGNSRCMDSIALASKRESSSWRKNWLYVTDFTAMEWCEKQVEFRFKYGKPEMTDAMKAGIIRHANLEEEVIKKVEVRVETHEDRWALKIMNFIVRAEQLMLEGLTRELPIFGFVEGELVVGVIDELSMPITGKGRILTLVDIKTRKQSSLPAEEQRRNGRLQLMFYKSMWDNLVSNNFSFEELFNVVPLDPHRVLSDEIKTSAAELDLHAETLCDLMKYLHEVCSKLPRAHDQLILRYELQKDNLLIGEDEFPYDGDWVKSQIDSCLQFWWGEREAKYVPEEERWKCRFCKFANVCPSQTQANSHSNSLNY